MPSSLLGDDSGRRYAMLLLLTLTTAGGCAALPSGNRAAGSSEPVRALYSGSADIQLNPEAPGTQLGLAQRYEDGRGVPRRASAAAFQAYLAKKQGYLPADQWLESRVALGQPQATYWLGVAQQARGETTLLALGLERLRAAAKAGDADAMFSLGTAYESGRGVEVDYAAARNWYEQAAEIGHPTAMCYLASMYAQGTGVARDDATAFRWYFRAASEKDAQGQFNVGNFIEAGRAGRPDPANAQIYFRQAAEQGHRDAQFNLAQLYNDGKGVPVNKAEALKWYTRAAAQGDAEARSKADQLKGLPSSAPAAVAGATAPKPAATPQPNADEPALTPEQQTYADHIVVNEYDGYFNDQALRGFFARKLGKPTLDHLAKGKHVIWVDTSSFKLENGKLYCLATIGLAERPPEGRSPRLPSLSFSGMNGRDANADPSPEEVRVCRVNALTSAVETMAQQSLDKQLEDIGYTAVAGKPAQGLKPDPTMAVLYSSGFANQDPVFDSISPDVRRAFDYRKLEWVVLAHSFHMGNRGVCVSSVGVAARAPERRNPHVPASWWQNIIELTPEGTQADPDLQQCKERATAAALTRARATEWDETGLLSGYERTREDGVALVKPARHPQLAANTSGKPAPQPFDLILGRSTLSQARAIWQREGGSVTGNGYGEAMPAAGDNNPDGVANPRVELFDVKGLPVDRLSAARFGFFDGGLYFIEYKFEERADFEKLLLQVTAKYGPPDHSPAGMNRAFEWQFGDVLLVLEDNFMGRDTMTFTHQSTRRAVSASHAAVYAAHVKKKASSQRGF